jgi:hypothetical protein
MDKEGAHVEKASDEDGTLRTNCAEGDAADVDSAADGRTRFRARLGAGPDRAIAAGAGTWRTCPTASVGAGPARVMDVTGAASVDPIEGAGLPRVRLAGPPICREVVLEVDSAGAGAENPIAAGAGVPRPTTKEGAGAPVLTDAAEGIPKTETRTAAAVANATAVTGVCRLT